MTEGNAIVFVVDDDPSMRRSLESLLRSVGHDVRLFSSAPEFMQASRPDVPACLVLDVRLPGMSGLAFQEELAKAGISLPIIFITGHGDVPMSVRAMKAGAAEFLTKPFDDQVLLDAVHAALERDRVRRREVAGNASLRSRYESLTERERQVMSHVVAGRPNKRIAPGTRPQRGDCESPSRARHAEDGGAVRGRAGAHGRQARRAAAALTTDTKV